MTEDRRPKTVDRESYRVEVAVRDPYRFEKPFLAFVTVKEPSSIAETLIQYA